MKQKMRDRKKGHGGSLSENVRKERNEVFSSGSISERLSHAFYRGAKCHLWYNAVL